MTTDIDYTVEYDNSGRVEGADLLIDTYKIDASLFRESDDRVADLNVVYGPEPRNKMDIFWPRTDEGRKRQSPLAMFIHGGYWQHMDRTDFSHMARGLNLQGFAVAIPSYTLCPENTIEGIIIEMRRACLVLYQTYGKKISVIGHSAGGHLAACMMATDWEALHSGLPYDLVMSGLGISGLYDLTPLLQTPINDVLNMDEEHARQNSPLLWVPDGSQRFEAWVGADESNEYHRQSRELANKWNLLGTPTNYVSVTGANHFTIIESLTDPDSQMTQRLVELVQNPQVEVQLPEPELPEVAQSLEDNAADAPEKIASDKPEPKVKKNVKPNPINKSAKPAKKQIKVSLKQKAKPSLKRNKPDQSAKAQKPEAAPEKQT